MFEIAYLAAREVDEVTDPVGLRLDDADPTALPRVVPQFLKKVVRIFKEYKYIIFLHSTPKIRRASSPANESPTVLTQSRMRARSRSSSSVWSMNIDIIRSINSIPALPLRSPSGSGPNLFSM